MKKRFGSQKKLIIASLLILISILAACSDSNSTGADGSVVELRLSHTGTKDNINFYSRYSNKFAELVEEHTQGEVKVITYGEGELYGNYIEMSKAVMDGSLDMGFIIPATAYPEAGIPEAAAVMLPRLLRSEADFYEFINREDAYGLVDQKLNERGAKRLDSILFGEYYIYTQEEVSSIEDFEGKIMRFGGGPIDLAATALGATPSPLSISEVYSGLQQGVIDGASTGLDGLVRRKWHEVTPYIFAENWPFTMYNVDLIISNPAWDKIPEEQQKVINEEVLPQLHEWGVEEAHKEWAKTREDLDEVGAIWTVIPEEEVEELDRLLQEKAYPEYKAISPDMKTLIEIAEEIAND